VQRGWGVLSASRVGQGVEAGVVTGAGSLAAAAAGSDAAAAAKSPCRRHSWGALARAKELGKQ